MKVWARTVVSLLKFLTTNLLVDECIKLIVEHEIYMTLNCANNILQPLVAQTFVSNLPVCGVIDHFLITTYNIYLVDLFVFKQTYERWILI